MDNEDTPLSPEWSHLYDADEASEKVQRLEIAPDEEARAALVKRLGLIALDECSAKLEIKRQKQIVHIRGSLRASVTQPCVVTLEPVATDVRDEFEAWYADPDAAISIAKKRREREMEKGKADLPMLEEYEDPEAIVDGQIDLGELVTQFLSLSIDPYVHADGVTFEQVDNVVQSDAGAEHRENPFAALKDWKDKL